MPSPEKAAVTLGVSSPGSNERASVDSSTETASEKSRDIVIHDLEKLLTPRVSNASQPPFPRRTVSVGITGTTDPNFDVDWDDENDPENPRNWSLLYKAMCIGFLSWNTFVVVFYSSSYTTGIADIAKEFNSPAAVVTLGLTLYLIGLAVGSVILAPMSEMYGRKPVSVLSLLFFTLLIIPCGIGNSTAELIVPRLFGAIAGSAMISSAPGSVADMVDDDHRALAFSVWGIAPLNGPVFGPIIGGYVAQSLGWRWTNWLVMIFSSVGFLFACVMKETYAPTLLRRKAACRRKETRDPRWRSRYDQKESLLAVLKVNLSRPFVMAVLEPICVFWNIYIAIVYSILYLCFVAYPIVFRDIRGWSTGMTGLSFLGIGMGSFITTFVEPLLRRMINNHSPDPETGKPPPEAMISVVCIAAVLIPVGQLWFAWTCSPATIHWIIPILAGIPFGAGNTGVFIYASNYLTFSYGIYAASAMAGNAVVRSLLGGILPLVGPYMYRVIGPNWSGTLLGLLEVLIIPIPLVFYRYGYKIRMKSALIRAMQEDKKKLDGKSTNSETRKEREQPPNEKEDV